MCASTLFVTTSMLVGGEPLDNTIPGQHASINGKVAADHEGTHGCILLSQHIGFICQIRLVLTSIDQDKTGISVSAPVCLV